MKADALVTQSEIASLMGKIDLGRTLLARIRDAFPPSALSSEERSVVRKVVDIIGEEVERATQ